jgi:hypothetical protein
VAVKAKEKKPGVLITVDGRWRCSTCRRVTDTTPICAGAHEDGSPSCGRAVCGVDADRCIRCKAPLCPDCYGRSKEGMLCVQCPPPPGGRQAYINRQRARTAYTSAQQSSSYDWRGDSERADRATAEAQQSVDEAMLRAAEIERQIAEMKERLKRSPNGS